MPSTNTNSRNPHGHSVKWVYYYLHFADGETEAEREATCPRSHTRITHHVGDSGACSAVTVVRLSTSRMPSVGVDVTGARQDCSGPLRIAEGLGRGPGSPGMASAQWVSAAYV